MNTETNYQIIDALFEATPQGLWVSEDFYEVVKVKSTTSKRILEYDNDIINVKIDIKYDGPLKVWKTAGYYQIPSKPNEWNTIKPGKAKVREVAIIDILCHLTESLAKDFKTLPAMVKTSLDPLREYCNAYDEWFTNKDTIEGPATPGKAMLPGNEITCALCNKQLFQQNGKYKGFRCADTNMIIGNNCKAEYYKKKNDGEYGAEHAHKYSEIPIPVSVDITTAKTELPRDENFTPYEEPKLGLFHITGDKYTDDGWEKKEEQYLILGEDDLFYIHELRETKEGRIPIRIHKSRLLNWIESIPVQFKPGCFFYTTYSTRVHQLVEISKPCNCALFSDEKKRKSTMHYHFTARYVMDGGESYFNHYSIQDGKIISVAKKDKPDEIIVITEPMQVQSVHFNSSSDYAIFWKNHPFGDFDFWLTNLVTNQKTLDNLLKRFKFPYVEQIEMGVKPSQVHKLESTLKEVLVSSTKKKGLSALVDQPINGLEKLLISTEATPIKEVIDEKIQSDPITPKKEVPAKVKSISESYPGGKNASGTPQFLINLIPPVDCIVSGFLGHCGVLKNIRPAKLMIGMDVDKNVIDRWNKERTNITLINDDFLKQTSWVNPKEVGKTLVFLDPPYLMETRSSQVKIYDHEFSSIDQHRMLLERAVKFPCYVMITAYENELYDSILLKKGFRKIKFSGQTRAGRVEECLYLNFDQPDELHDYSFVGNDYRERWNNKKIVNRTIQQLESMPALRRNMILSNIQQHFK